MFKNNLKAGIVFKYFDIQELNDGTWIAWFFHDIDFNQFVKDEVKDKGAS